MAQFDFHLDGVLRHREYIEHEKQRAVAALQAEVSMLQGELKNLDQTVQQSTADLRANHLTGPLNMGFLAAHRRFMIAMQRRAMGLAQVIAQVQIKLQDAQKELAAAAVQRKIMEKLKERQQTRWRDDRDRRELQQQDEITMQLSYRNHVEDREVQS